MTEKRFHYRIDEVGIYYYVCDNTKKGDDRIILEFDTKYDAMEVCELLNELHEKNKLLLQRNGAMEEEIECLSEEIKDLNDVLARYEEMELEE